MNDHGDAHREPERLTVERVRSLLEGLATHQFSHEYRTARYHLDAASGDLARAYLEACAERDAAYARGALDMRTRAAAVAQRHRPLSEPWGSYPGAAEYDRGRDDAAESIADDIEALDVEVPQ